MSSKKIIGYMDRTDFYYELGEALGGNKIYPSIDDLVENESCAFECGVVRVSITLEEDIINYSYNDRTKEEFDKLVEKYKSRRTDS